MIGLIQVGDSVENFDAALTVKHLPRPAERMAVLIKQVGGGDAAEAGAAPAVQ